MNDESTGYPLPEEGRGVKTNHRYCLRCGRGGYGPFCYGCNQCVEEDEQADRLAGACLAMSRFLVWVWMEATIRRWHRLGGCSYENGDGNFDGHDCDCRAALLANFLNQGRLRLSWPEETP